MGIENLVRDERLQEVICLRCFATRSHLACAGIQGINLTAKQGGKVPPIVRFRSGTNDYPLI